MAEPEIYSNPQRLLALAADLRMLNNDLRAELAKMKDGLHHLGATWQDEEFQKFKRVFEQLNSELILLDQEISKREPELRVDAQLLKDYLSKSM